MPLIMPIKDLRNTTEISNIAHKAQEPIFITKNGYSDLVVMSSELYDKFAKIKINPKAIRELDNIYEYIGKEKSDPENARGQIDRIKKAILGLELFPQSHQEHNL